MANNDFFTYKQFTIDQRHAAMKVGTDSDLLGALAAGGRRILDIGTGTGIISLMMAQRFPEAHITAIEIDDNAAMDAAANFSASPFSDRIELIHISFQDYLKEVRAGIRMADFDCIVCNPPYFDRSTECGKNIGRTRARHTSSLPFPVLIEGSYSLLTEGGVFSVCIPPEVLSIFTSDCIIEGFWPKNFYKIKAVPSNPPKRYVLVHQRGFCDKHEYTYCMRNDDRTRSDWYNELMSEFHKNV